MVPAQRVCDFPAQKSNLRSQCIHDNIIQLTEPPSRTELAILYSHTLHKNPTGIVHAVFFSGSQTGNKKPKGKNKKMFSMTQA